jgi:DNA (cytosine-5)-methyltransferase 1
MCLNAGAMGRRDAETETLIPTTGAVFDVVDVAPTLRAGGNATGGTRPYGTDVDTCDSLIPVALNENQQGAVWGSDTFQALNKGGGKPGQGYPCVAFSAKDYGADAMADCSPTLRAGGFADSHQNGGVMPAVAYAIQERAVSENLENGPQGKGFQEGVAYTLEARNKVQATAFALRGREGGAMPEIEGDQVGALRAASGGSSRSYVAASAVRRLTPRECERLQGFPDDYTLIPWRKKSADQCPDGPRYKALGNSMAVPCMRWLGERIQRVEEICSMSAKDAG